ncbi:hypothetical protein [Dactylosporangium sp. CA-233914]|uniref:hypothetical protein n=1 Tax=Dactylosporangium sp. CA-233914 TaxID=3239934 RepID=UPI003D8BCD80
MQRRGIWIGLLVATVLAGLGFVAAAGFRTGEDIHGPSPDCDGTPPKIGTAVRAGDRLAVEEQGFGTIAERNAIRVIGIGAVLINRSASAAYRTEVSLTLHSAVEDRVLWSGPPQRIPVILPGGRAAVGAYAWLPTTDAASAARMSVEIGPTHWLEAGEANHLFEADLRSVAAFTLMPSSPGVTAAEFDIGPSVSCELLTDGGAGVVFRDSRGTVLAGAPGSSTHNGFCGHTDSTFAKVDLIPPEADLRRTQISIYCDLDTS